MKTFKSFLTEAPTGDCFPTAGRYMMNMDDDMERAGMRMVHALIPVSYTHLPLPTILLV